MATRTTDIKISFEQYDWVPGEGARLFQQHLRQYGEVDVEGWSHYDVYTRVDTGAVDAAGNPAAGAPAIAAGAAGRKERIARRARLKNSYRFLCAHISSKRA